MHCESCCNHAPALCTCDVTMYKIIKMPESPATLKVGSKRLLPIKAYDDFMEAQFTEA